MRPPKLAQKLISWFLKEELLEEVLGDLLESYAHNQKSKGKGYARRRYWVEVFKYLRPFAIRGKFFDFTNSRAMYFNYLKVGFRTFNNSRGYSLINVGGLAVGMMVAILIGLWVHDELTFNQHHSNFDRIAKVYRTNTYEGETDANTSQVTGLGTLLANSYSNHFEHVAMVRARTEYRVLALNDKKFTQSGYFMQPQGPEMFSLEMVYGTRDGLTDMSSIFLSWSTAKKFFGDLDPVGKTLTIDGKWELMVTGVYKDLPGNSEFADATFFGTIDWYLEGWSHLEIWDNYNMYIYVTINENTDFTTVSTAIQDAMLPHVNEKTASTQPTLFLHPMKDWHLNSDFENGVKVLSKRLQFVLIFGAIGAFVLILACINFINLSTARAEKRSKEVGIRKSIGSQRHQLIGQFLTESFLIVSMSFVLSLVLVQLMLPLFSGIAGKSIQLPWIMPEFWLLGIGFVIITSLLAGSYPAFYLSSFNPLRVLKGKASSGKLSALPRKVLVVFQFVISIVLLIGTIGIYKQIEHGKDRPVGYVREGLIELRPRSPEYYSSYDVLRTEFLNTGVVEEMGESNYSIMSTLGWNHGFDWEGRPENYDPAFNTIAVTHEYGKAVGLQFLQGRDFSREGSADKNGILINESALELFNIENPVGTVLTYDPGWKEPTQVTIIGIVKDMIKGSPFESTDPSVMFLSEDSQNLLYIRIKDGIRAGEALPLIESVFTTRIPSAPFDYKFADDEYNTKFKQEESIGTLAGFFCAIAILISCLGLFGLSSFMAEQRTKEIGIRKVLGATTVQLWKMLSRDFVFLVLIAGVISMPLSYYFLQSWLSNYEIQTLLPAWIFISALLGAFLITLVTVSFQAIRAALSNPTDSLKNE